MDVLEKFSDSHYASAVLKEISSLARHAPSQTIKFMEVCGTHTFAIMRSGIPNLLPENVQLISGPGCPVCVTPPELIDAAAEIAKRERVVFATFGDMMRVPGTKYSLESAKAVGANIRILYSPAEFITLAQDAPDKRIVFFAVGFETTAPGICWTMIRADELGLKNLFIVPAHKLIPPALDCLASDAAIQVNGFILPGHVGVITGADAFEPMVNEHHIPCVVAGFEPLDVLLSIRMLLLQVIEERAEVEIEYRRVVTKAGNEKARAVVNEVFEPADSAWRGLGVIPNSGLSLRPRFQHMDALREMEIIPASNGSMPAGCACGEVLKGLKIPTECALFRSCCTPDNPIGPCIISSEGTCAAYYKYAVE